MKDSNSLDLRKLASLVGIAVIALVFTLQFGPGSQGCQAGIGDAAPTAAAAATVNGKEIPAGDFRSAYQRMLSQYRAQGLDAKLARQLGLHKQVIDSMVNEELWAQAAEKRGISTSDEELADVLAKNPSFHKDGKFDVRAYRDTVRQYLRKTDVEFERELRRSMAAQKLQEMVASSAVVSDDEVKARFEKEGNRAQATFVRFAPTMFADKTPAPTGQELDAYKQAHAKEIEDYYNANKFLYSQPEQFRVRQILIRADSPEKKAEAKQKIENLRKEIVDGGKDFAEMAKQFSEDLGSKAQGGDMGSATLDSFPREIATALPPLKKGEVSQPIEAETGVYLVKLEDKTPPMNKPLKDVEGEIATQLWKREKAKDVARAEAEKALAAVKAGQDLKTLFPAPAEEEGQEQQFRFQQPTNPVAVETGEFNASTEALPRLGTAPNVLPEIFARTAPGALDKVYEVGDAYVAVVVTDRKQASQEDYEKQKEQLVTQARRAKEFELRDAFLKSLKASSDVKMNDATIEEIIGPEA